MAVDRNAKARAQFAQKMGKQSGNGLLSADSETQGGEITPEEEKIIDTAAVEAGKFIYQNDKSSDAVMKAAAREPFAENIGKAAAQVTANVDSKMNIPEELVIPVGVKVVEQIHSLGVEMGVFEDTPEMVQNAVAGLIRSLYEHYGADPADMEQAIAESGLAPEELKRGVEQFAQQAGGSNNGV